ncbi:nuclear transport factor 2 family protein [Nocardia sp. NPDC051570]|uniref:nuclear transport factor 2 family protein n=1 Tax=Nocardia sp. NPDC051570 TaxID=3364324 RepID=UPI00379A10EF
MTDLRLDAAKFAAEAERMTNEVAVDEWEALYHHDAVAEWIFDGVRRSYAGIEEIRPALAVLAELWRNQPFRVRKTVQCADSDTIVLTYEGGFRGRTNQFGTEIWTLRDGLVVRHQMYCYVDVRGPESIWANVRMLLIQPRLALAALRSERRHRAA